MHKKLKKEPSIKMLNETFRRIYNSENSNISGICSRLKECLDVADSVIDPLCQALGSSCAVAFISFDEMTIIDEKEYSQFATVFEDKIKEAELEYLVVDSCYVYDTYTTYKSFLVWSSFIENDDKKLFQMLQHWNETYEDINICVFKYNGK